MEDVPMRGAAKSEKTGERSAQTIKIVLKSVEATVDARYRDRCDS